MAHAAPCTASSENQAHVRNGAGAVHTLHPLHCNMYVFTPLGVSAPMFGDIGIFGFMQIRSLTNFFCLLYASRVAFFAIFLTPFTMMYT